MPSTGKLIITGGQPLLGSVRVGGAKNASYKLMIAALLADTPSRILNFSKINDVQTVAEIIGYLGGEVRESGERALLIDPTQLNNFQIQPEHGAQGRFSTMFIPALVAKFGQAIVPPPGGDKIGDRPLDRHFDGLQALGINVSVEDGMYVARAKKITGANYKFTKNTHTGTETMIMAAVKAEGKTVLENCALEPEIDDLIALLNNMGAWIRRRPNRVIEIVGVPRLSGAIHQVMPDSNEAVSYACAALATKGDVVVENAQAGHITAFLDTLSQIGAGYEVGNYGVRFFYHQPLKAAHITTAIHPGFKTDWQPLMATVLTQCTGESSIHETVVANRFQYVEPLQKMGANISFYNPAVSNFDNVYNFDQVEERPEYHHAIKIVGPTPLKAGQFAVKDLRHGATLIVAALAATGVSTITNLEQVDRGYESLDVRLKSMGANIRREE